MKLAIADVTRGTVLDAPIQAMGRKEQYFTVFLSNIKPCPNGKHTSYPRKRAGQTHDLVVAHYSGGASTATYPYSCHQPDKRQGHKLAQYREHHSYAVSLAHGIVGAVSCRSRGERHRAYPTCGGHPTDLSLASACCQPKGASGSCRGRRPSLSRLLAVRNDWGRRSHYIQAGDNKRRAPSRLAATGAYLSRLCGL